MDESGKAVEAVSSSDAVSNSAKLASVTTDKAAIDVNIAVPSSIDESNLSAKVD